MRNLHDRAAYAAKAGGPLSRSQGAAPCPRQDSRPWRHPLPLRLRAWAGLLALAPLVSLAVGCAGAKVAVPTNQFPVPLVEKVALPIGLYLDEALLTYRYEENLEQRGDWEIELGSAQPSLFNNLLAGMFIGHRRVQRLQGGHPDLAGVLSPSIEEVQFATPEQTRSSYYEVWLRYQFKLHDNQGAELGVWDLTAYGKAHEQNHSGSASALQGAAMSSCRDAMAFFTQQFATVPVVQNWLAQELGGAA